MCADQIPVDFDINLSEKELILKVFEALKKYYGKKPITNRIFVREWRRWKRERFLKANIVPKGCPDSFFEFSDIAGDGALSGTYQRWKANAIKHLM